jgi:hypothetical protein
VGFNTDSSRVSWRKALHVACHLIELFELPGSGSMKRPRGARRRRRRRRRGRRGRRRRRRAIPIGNFRSSKGCCAAAAVVTGNRTKSPRRVAALVS